MMRPRQSVLLRRLLLAGALLLAPVALAQETEEQPTLEEAIAQHQQYILSLRQEIERRPDDEQLWMGLVDAEGMMTAMRRQAGLDPAPPGEDWQVALVDRIYGEWIARSPDLPTAHLAHARAQPDPERRMTLLRQALARFPDHLAPRRDLARVLVQRGEAAEATRLLEEHVAAHPEDAEGWKMLADFHEGQGNGARAREAQASWLALDDHSAEALQARLVAATGAQDEAAARRVAARMLAVLAPLGDRGAIHACESLARSFEGAMWTEAVECLEATASAATDEQVRAEAQTASARVVARTGNVAEARQAIDRLPSERRAAALLSVGSSFAGGGRCAEAVETFASLRGVEMEGIHLASTASRVLGNHCRGSGEARQLVFDLIGEAEAYSIGPIVELWSDAFDPAEIEALLRRRLTAEPEQDQLWEALDEQLTAAGDFAAREEHLRAWVEARPGHPTERYLALADLATDIEPAVALLERALEETARDLKVVEALAGYYLMAGRPESAAALAADLAAADDAQTAARGGLLLARLAMADGDPERSLDLYGGLLGGEGVPAEVPREMAMVLAELGREAEAVALFGERYDAALREGAGPGVSREAYVAGELAAVGLAEEALEAWMRAIAEEAVDADGLRAAGDLARDLERWREAELAYGKLLELDPQNGHLWGVVASLAADRGDQRALERLAADARAATGSVPSRIGLALGQSLLRQGDLVRAITLLREARRQNLYDPEISRALDEAYVRLARQSRGSRGEP